MDPDACPRSPRHVHVATADGWQTRAPARNAVHAAPDRPGEWHGQYGQDRVVATLLGSKRRGYFVDMAASEPLLHSNTRTLERDFGWRGVCIEPNWRFWPKLLAWRDCCVVGAAVAEKRGEAAWGGHLGMGGLLRIANDTARVGGPETMRVQTVTAAELVGKFGLPSRIDYMSVDLEGAEGVALSTWPWSTHRPAVISVERPRKSLQAALAARGYRYHCTVLTNKRVVDQIWTHPEELQEPARAPRGAAAASKAAEPMVLCDRLYARTPLAMPQWNASRAGQPATN